MSHQMLLVEIRRKKKMTIKAFAKFIPSANNGLIKDIHAENLARWDPSIQAKASNDASINMYDVIGKTYDGDGVRLRMVDAILRQVGDESDVTININSPGGDYYEGVAIYSRLREHKGKVTVKILGLAASAASVIAMAGDKILIAKPANIMIHNAWGVAVGNAAKLIEAAEHLDKLSTEMAGIYSDKTGVSNSRIQALMDVDTHLNGPKSVDMNFAHGLLESDQIARENNKKTNSLAEIRRIEYALQKEGINDDEVKEIMSSFNGSQDDATHSEIIAADAKLKSEILAGLNQLRENFK